MQYLIPHRSFLMMLFKTIGRPVSTFFSRSNQVRCFAVAASETEQALRDALSNYCKAVIQPKVSEMDHKGVMDPSIVKSLFEQV